MELKERLECEAGPQQYVVKWLDHDLTFDETTRKPTDGK